MICYKKMALETCDMKFCKNTYVKIGNIKFRMTKNKS